MIVSCLSLLRTFQLKILLLNFLISRVSTLVFFFTSFVSILSNLLTSWKQANSAFIVSDTEGHRIILTQSLPLCLYSSTCFVNAGYNVTSTINLLSVMYALISLCTRQKPYAPRSFLHLSTCTIPPHTAIPQFKPLSNKTIAIQ